MRTTGRLADYKVTGDGVELAILLEDAETVDAIAKLKDEIVTVEIKKSRLGRSLTANAYFWKLCDMIARAIGSDKETVYLMMLEQCGVFETLEVKEAALPILRHYMRLVVEEYRFEIKLPHSAEFERFCGVKAYKGSHEFDTKEMSDLIAGTVATAKDLGLQTYPQEEIDLMVREWKGRDCIYD